MQTASERSGVADGEVRRAKVAERGQILAVLAEAFTPTGARESLSSRKTHPYLWHDARVSDHFVFVREGRVIGCVGLYPYDVAVGGVRFRSAGVGQVACLKAYRGRGVMSAILRRVCMAHEEMELDFSWLWGDRQRYGRYGWVLGGVAMHYETFDRYLPPPPPGTDVERLDATRATAPVLRLLRSQPDTVLMEPAELRLLLGVADVRVYRQGGALVVARQHGAQVAFARGTPERIAGLLSHALRQLRRRPDKSWKLAVECPPRPSPLLACCLEHHWRAVRNPCANLRIGRLVPFLQKACAAAQPGVSRGDDRLELVNRDTGEAATLLCRRGSLRAEPGAGRRALRLTTAQLSGLCLGVFPPELFARGLRPDSPLRAVLPLAVHIPHFFAL